MRKRVSRPSIALPRRIEHVDIVHLDLTPAEAFVLTQLDGATELAEVAVVTHMSEDELERVVARLVKLGVVVLGTAGGREQARKPDPRRDDDAPVQSERVFRAKPVREGPTKEEEVVELDEEQRELLDDLDSQPDGATHYQLLGIEPSAALREVKDAYFGIVGAVHPDAYFGKKLGSCQQKMERAFQRLTLAYDVLSRHESRREYDQYLGLRRVTRALDAVIQSVPPPESVSAATGHAAPSSSQTLASDEKRRQRLAAQLKPPAARQATAKLSPEEARDRLQRLAAERQAVGQTQRVESFLLAAEQALQERDWTAAVNSLRIASTLAPDDEKISSQLQDAEQRAAGDLVETYRARAAYEERNQQWAEAAASHQRVAVGRPNDANPLERAARCLLRAGEARQAVHVARKAVALEPDVPSRRIVLARAHEASGLLTSAIAELERADSLKGGDPEIRNRIARIRKAQEGAGK